MGFELFDRREKRGPRRAGPGGVTWCPFVTVTNHRAFLVDRTATEALGNPTRVLLFFDRGRRRTEPAGQDGQTRPAWRRWPGGR